MKIGIITMFYKTINYGGKLQAYALCNALNKMGHDAEQIKYERKEGFVSRKELKREHFATLNIKEKFIKVIIYIWKRIFNKLQQKQICSINEEMKNRKKAFEQFSFKNIYSSEGCYDSFSVNDVEDKYDAFIVGSDQIWSEFSIDVGYSLDFVNSNKMKVAYAASGIGKSISSRHSKIFSKILPTYKAVSVREKHAVDLLQPMYNKKIKHVCDPVLLLSSLEWDKISSARIVKEKYIFCYFLGEDKKFRKLAIEFAKKRGLKTVFIPFLKGRYCSADYKIGDYRIVDASPSDFISLIKNAEYVFTDSFHVCAFSTIYQKQFFAFKRSDTGGIERIKNIIELSGAHDHLIDEKNNLKITFLESMPEISYNHVNENIEKFRNESFEFLENALKD